MELLKLNLFIFISLAIGNLIAGSRAYTSDADCRVDLTAGICDKLCCQSASGLCYYNQGLFWISCDCMGLSAPSKFYCSPSPGGTCQTASNGDCYQIDEIVYDCVVPGVEGPICTCGNPQ